MVKRTHMVPRERQEMVDNLMEQLKPQLEQFVENKINSYAITDKDVAARVIETIERIEPRWFTRLFFKLCLPRKPKEEVAEPPPENA